MDLASFDTVKAASEGAVMPVRHPVTKAALKTEKGDPVTITVYGHDSRQFKERERAMIDRRLNAGRSRSTSAEDLEGEALDLLAACVKSWENVEVDGKMLDCTPQNVRSALARFPWLKEQIDVFVGDRANFLSA